jgi:hypothetical protein
MFLFCVSGQYNKPLVADRPILVFGGAGCVFVALFQAEVYVAAAETGR